MEIAICCVAYNRDKSLYQLLQSIEKAYYDASPITLIISIDKSDTDKIECLANDFLWKYGEKRIIKHQSNLGLRNHILSCGELLTEFDALIVLEDDITVSPSFYYYAKQCVEKYCEDLNCAGISLYNFARNYHNQIPFIPLKSDSDVYKMRCAQSWGQVWMRKQWIDFREWYDKHNKDFEETSYLPKSICHWPRSSWLKYHTRYCIETKKYFIYPYTSLSTNNGDVGTHVTRTSSSYQVSFLYGLKTDFNLNPRVEYDGFFENMNLYHVLGFSEQDLCIDLYGEKENREQKRYWLTRNRNNYRIIESFALDLCPWEVNIFEKRSGDQIYLYDTSILNKNRFPKNDDFANYYYPISLNMIKKIVLTKLNNKICDLWRLR